MPAITNKLSDRLKVGINIYRGIQPANPGVLASFINQEIAKIKESYLKELPPGFSFSRKLYRAFHIDPTKTRPSSEALWRRLKNKDDFPSVNPFVDLTNLLSLKFQICFGLYDIDRLDGDITIDVGAETDFYEGIRKDTIHLKGKIALKDHLGPFGNPSADSPRTAVTETAANILQVLFFHPHDPDAQALTKQALDTCTRLFRPTHSQIRLI